MKLLELFCGTKSITKIAKDMGWDCKTLDFSQEFNPDICKSILDFDLPDLGNWRPDIIWASPPCTCFSVASLGHHWTGGKQAYIPKTEEAKIAIEIAKKTMLIIKSLKPKYYFIENPRGVLRKLNIIKGIRNTVTYCQYGDKRMKPTDIWTNNELWVPKPMCHNGDPCHEAAPRGARTGTQGLKGAMERGIIPPQLCKEILESCL